MARRRTPTPEAELARWYRRAREARDEERAGLFGPAGFAYAPRYRGEYARRPGYALPRGVRRPPAPLGSGWPGQVRDIPPEAEARHLAALADRDLARAVVAALYQTIGEAADGVGVRARDGVIVLDGRVATPRAAWTALETARAVPGVRRVRSALRYRE